MIAHLVLFTPKSGLSAEDREAGLVALERACVSIPEIKRATFGRRRTLGHEYDAAAPMAVEYAVLLEFETEDDLRTYLHHPAHVALGHHFHNSSELAMAIDFTVGDASQIRAIAGLDSDD